MKGSANTPIKKTDIKKDGAFDGKTETEVMKAPQNAETDASQNALKKENDEDELFE